MDKVELYYPIKKYSVNQPFGQNWNPVYKQQGLKGHNGIDLLAVHGQKVFAAHDGVCMPQVDDHGGNGVVLISDILPNGTQWKTLYWHLIDDNAVVQTGQKIKAGDLLGYADNTGQSTGDHLHFGLYFFPQDFNNGYNGATDPQPYFNGKYAEDINTPILPVKFQFTKTLKLGSWNNEVKQLQTFLKGLGYDLGSIDGIFGPKTQLAVKTWQIANKLVGDGVVGIKTITLLNSLI